MLGPRGFAAAVLAMVRTAPASRLGGGPGARRAGAVPALLPQRADDRTEQRLGRDSPAGLGSVAWQPDPARLVAQRRVLLRDRPADERSGPDDRRAAAGDGPHLRGGGLRGGPAARRTARQGTGPRAAGHCPDAADRRHHARAVDGAGLADPAAGARSRGHADRRAGDVPRDRPRGGALVGSGGRGRPAHRGAGQRRAGDVLRRGGRRGGLWRASLLGGRPLAAPAAGTLVRRVARGGGGGLLRPGAPDRGGNPRGGRLLPARTEKRAWLRPHLRDARPDVGDRLQRAYLVRRRLHRAADGDQRHLRAAASGRGGAGLRGAVDSSARVLHPDGPGQPDARGRHGLHPDSRRVRHCTPGRSSARTTSSPCCRSARCSPGGCSASG